MDAFVCLFYGLIAKIQLFLGLKLTNHLSAQLEILTSAPHAGANARL